MVKNYIILAIVKTPQIYQKNRLNINFKPLERFEADSDIKSYQNNKIEKVNQFIMKVTSPKTKKNSESQNQSIIYNLINRNG